MVKFTYNRLWRTVSAFFAECLVTGVWALIDTEFVTAHASWFVLVGLGGLAVVWFAGQIREFIEWKLASGNQGAQSRSPIDFSYGVYADASRVEDEGGNKLDDVWAVTFCLAITNTSQSGATLRRLQAVTRVTLSDSIILPIRESGSGAINLRHGEIATIEIGNVFVSDANMTVMPRAGLRRVVTKHPDSVAHNALHGHRMLFLSDYAGVASVGVGGGSKPPTPWVQSVSISANDVIGRTVLLEVDLHSDQQWEWVRIKSDE